MPNVSSERKRKFIERSKLQKTPFQRIMKDEIPAEKKGVYDFFS